jgi:hypothetical protein
MVKSINCIHLVLWREIPVPELDLLPTNVTEEKYGCNVYLEGKRLFMTLKEATIRDRACRYFEDKRVPKRAPE